MSTIKKREPKSALAHVLTYAHHNTFNPTVAVISLSPYTVFL